MKSLLTALLLACLLPGVLSADEPQLATYTYNLQQGWNLIGLTLIPTEESAAELLSRKIFAYEEEGKEREGYRQPETLTVGKAYWIYSEKDESFVLKGTPAGKLLPGMETGTSRFALGTETLPGEEVTATAPEKEGYTFAGWTVEGVTIPDTSAPSLTFTMPANDVSFYMHYTVNRYALTVDGVEEQVAYGTPVTRTAPAREGYHFTGWAISGLPGKEITANPLTFTMPANDVTLTPVYLSTTATYLVVNLENGTSYETNDEPDLASDLCRTTELWLRKIPRGTFTMGSPGEELGRQSDETSHSVTLTQDFYIGIFEVTQRQWEEIHGDRPSYFHNDAYYATRPVERVNYSTIRGSNPTLGAGWPRFGHAVDPDSFLGILRAKTGLPFDLPTEAQWEYACRANTTTALNSGKNLIATDQCKNLASLGRYYANGGADYTQEGDPSTGSAKVGSYAPNNWGLYDMHGNASEWCLDWRQEDLGSAEATDPVGPSSNNWYRSIRGGGWFYDALGCRSAYRIYGLPDGGSSNSGLRLTLTLP